MGMYKKAKALGRKAVKAVKKRYMAKPGGRKSTGGVRVAKMARDIMYLKSVLNPEKKRFELNTNTVNLVGQLNAITGSVSDGRYFIDATPTPTQGVTYNTRNGASIKLHSSMWHFQFSQEVSTVADVRLCIELFSIKGETYTGFNFFNERYSANPFIRNSISGLSADIRDINSQLNPDNFMKGQLVARRWVTIKADTVSSVKNTVDLKMPIKYNKGQGHHIRFDKDTQTVESGQLYLVIRADRGNIGSVAASNLTGVPDVGPNTGIQMVWNRVDYFYDN